MHDARNLMGALGLYCDLLSMPGVLKPEHQHYPEELRLLGDRSQALIEGLMRSLPSQVKEDGVSVAPVVDRIDGNAVAVRPVALRSVVERCCGLLSRLSGGVPIEVTYGAAAEVLVRVEEETVERILVNLVRNASAALETVGDKPASSSSEFGSVRERFSDVPDSGIPGAIRIGVGMLVNRGGDAKPWPFRRVRLTVEDSGCGMAAEQLERLCGGRAPSRGSHGIGFRVVRQLVAESEGDLSVKSQPGVGTRVQIEWPVALLSDIAVTDLEHESGAAASQDLSDAGRLNLC